MSERSELTISTGTGEAPSAEQLIGAYGAPRGTEATTMIRRAHR